MRDHPAGVPGSTTTIVSPVDCQSRSISGPIELRLQFVQNVTEQNEVMASRKSNRRQIGRNPVGPAKRKTGQQRFTPRADRGAALDQRCLRQARPAILCRECRGAGSGSGVEQTSRCKIRTQLRHRMETCAHRGIGRRHAHGEIGARRKIVRQMRTAVARFVAIALGETLGRRLQVGKRHAFKGLVHGSADLGRQFHDPAR